MTRAMKSINAGIERLDAEGTRIESNVYHLKEANPSMAFNVTIEEDFVLNHMVTIAMDSQKNDYKFDVCDVDDMCDINPDDCEVDFEGKRRSTLDDLDTARVKSEECMAKLKKAEKTIVKLKSYGKLVLEKRERSKAIMDEGKREKMEDNTHN